jgi:transcription elongation factor GreA
MADTKTYQMTREGFEELEAELDNLKLVKRAEVVERIKVARSYGDLSENSEYEAAKDEQAFVEGRIATVETMIRNAEIVDNAGVKSNEVALGKTVTFVEVGEDEKKLTKLLVLPKRILSTEKSQMNHQSRQHLSAVKLVIQL